MKIQHGSPTAEQPYHRYFLTGETPEELRWLTVLRNLLAERGKARLRFMGADRMGKTVAGLPPDPVSKVCLAVEDPEEALPGTPQAIERLLDPQHTGHPAPIAQRRKTVARAAGGRTIQVQVDES